tara:strand:- start:250 stop:471 length:222 start_codon:yes stop_codon:yes gene_type:complete
MNTFHTKIHALFSQDELVVLKLFYSGVHARLLRKEHTGEPWEIVSRHRKLPKELYAALNDELAFVEVVTKGAK